MFNGDGLLIMLVLLLFWGAKDLPNLARGLGEALREFLKAKDEIERELAERKLDPQAEAEEPEAPTHGRSHWASQILRRILAFLPLPP